MSHSIRYGIVGTLLAVVLLLSVPIVDCSSCSGAGTIKVMGSHPEAMGSEKSPTGVLQDVACPACDGNARVSLFRKLM